MMKAKKTDKRAREEEPKKEKDVVATIESTRVRGSSSSAINEETSQIVFSLVVKWSSASQSDHAGGTHGSGNSRSKGKIKTTRLHLSSINDISKLGGLKGGLLDRAFPIDGTPRPHYLTSDQFLRFTPNEDCLSFPMDVVSTEFKLVALYEGWEYVVYASPLLNREQDMSDGTPVIVTAIEFESVAVVLGNLGLRVSLVAYPIVSISREWLLNVKKSMVTDPTFKGVLTSIN